MSCPHILPTLLLLGILSGCSGPKSDSGVPGAGEGPTLQVASGQLVDSEGRQVLLRGVNARVNGLFDVTFDDGRVALEEIPPFTGEDCRFLAEDLGLNLLRLPVNWSGIEPASEVYDQAYLDRVTDLVDDCAAVGVWTIVDLHQDAYGKDIGEDGAPLWAIHPAPDTLLEGPLTAEELVVRRTSAVVLQAFSSLYDNAVLENGRPVRDAYAEMAAVLAASLDGHPGAVALELHNEPVSPGQQARLDAFHEAVTAAVREVAPDLPVVFEPDALRNLTDSAPMDTPFGWDNAIYGPHIYTDVFEDGWASEDTEAVRASVSRAAEEAVFHDAHLFIGEFGNDPRSERGQLYLETCFDAFDAHRASWAMWLYEEHSQDAWGLWDEGDVPHTRGALREEAADLLARAYPMATAGQLETVDWDADTRTLQVTFSSAGDAPHVLAAPERTFPAGVAVSCDGEAVAPSDVGFGRVEVRCAGQVLELSSAE